MPSKSNRGRVRIIAGEWRSRRLPVIDVPGLRPSGDRSRETLFNWLQMHVPGSRCADLFAGTGALGFEAASRGAASVVLVEKNARVVNYLRDSVAALEAGNVQVHEGNALDWLDQQAPASIDILFIDPPFEAGLTDTTLRHVSESGSLAAGALVYVESDAAVPAPLTPPRWDCHREKVLGGVRMQLFHYSGDTEEGA